MSELGPLLPTLRTSPPGPASRALAERLRGVESRNVTWLGDDFPVFWEEARGANVRDADGNVYLDWTAAFGVALMGHRAPTLTAALRRQADRLVHGMGDVHPTAIRVELLERLAALMPWPSTRGVLASSGSEAVEIALKTAHLATGRPGILAFEGGYHGLTLGALAATARPYFREPFEARLYGGVVRVPFPEEEGEPTAAALEAADRALRHGAPDHSPIGAVVVEPVQARGGVRVMPRSFGAQLTALARRHGAVLIADEVFTGLGRCGAILASGVVGLEPDLVCLGKVLGGGLPLSACLGPAEVLDAWPASPGEALHTSTFLGHPLACATALAVVAELEDGLAARVEAAGSRLRGVLADALEERGDPFPLRGMGLLLGVEVTDARGAPLAGAGPRAAEAALAEGLLVLPAGDVGSVVEMTPPACLTTEQEAFGAGALARALDEALAGRAAG